MCPDHYPRVMVAQIPILSDNNGQTSVRDSDKLYSLKQRVKSVAESLMAVIESDNDGEANFVM